MQCAHGHELNMSGKPRFSLFAMLIIHFLHPTPLCLGPLILVALCLRNIETQTIRIEVHLVARVLQNRGNVPCVLKLPQVHVRPALLDGVTNQLRGTGLTLGADDGGLLLLAGFVDDEGGALGFLLGDLLGFNGGGEFGGEGEVLGVLVLLFLWLRIMTYCERDIIKHDVESRRSPHEVVPHQPGHVLTLSDQLTGVELRNHALEHLVDDGR
jgi:hypothetical protein